MIIHLHFEETDLFLQAVTWRTRVCSSGLHPPYTVPLQPRAQSEPSSPLEVRAWFSAFVLEVVLSKVALRVWRSLLNWESEEGDRMSRTKTAQVPSVPAVSRALCRQSSILPSQRPSAAGTVVTQYCTCVKQSLGGEVMQL